MTFPGPMCRIARLPNLVAVTAIELQDLSKRYGRTVAVDGLSFTVLPGRVTGFAGPNGAGKSTTMRVILGLDAPTSGTALVGGSPYRRLRRPLCRVGALLDAGALHPGRRGRDHLLWMAHSNGIPARRVDEVLALVGLASVARRRAGGFSLGMKQRLGIAAALLGDPPVLLFDEPINGLDPEGVHWARGFLRALAAEGRTVLVSSHLMSELEGTADHLVVIGQGRLISESSVRDLLAAASGGRVLLRTPLRAKAWEVLSAAGATVDTSDPESLTVAGLSTERLTAVLAEHAVPVTELTAHRVSLEEVYLRMTQHAVDYRSPR